VSSACAALSRSCAPPLATPAGNASKIACPRCRVRRMPSSSTATGRKDWHSSVVAENPGLHNNAISVIIGDRWRAENDHVRDEYKRTAGAAGTQGTFGAGGAVLRTSLMPELRRVAESVSNCISVNASFLVPRQCCTVARRLIALRDEYATCLEIQSGCFLCNSASYDCFKRCPATKAQWLPLRQPSGRRIWSSRLCRLCDHRRQVAPKSEAVAFQERHEGQSGQLHAIVNPGCLNQPRGPHNKQDGMPKTRIAMLAARGW